MSDGVGRIVPDVDDPMTSPFWTAARQRRLVIQQCVTCGRMRWPATEVCAACLGEESCWTETAPEGRIWSFATYHRAFHPGFATEIPYVVGIVEVGPDVHLVGRIHGDPAQVAVGAGVRAVFEPITGDVTLVAWELV